MYLVIEKTKQSFSFPDSNILLVGNDFECDVQINHPKIWGRHFSIKNNSYGCVLEVFNTQVQVNDQNIYEQCMLDTGDVLEVDELTFRLLDDSYIPKDSKINHTNIEISDTSNVSSVYGLRSFSATEMGQFIIDDFHHPDGWHVFRKDNDLHFVDSKHATLLNGMQIAQAKLSNGDVISNPKYKYKVELPGTSGFSKFSPSHPRNVLLSESFANKNTDDDTGGKPPKPDFLRNNLWWLTLLVGLIVLVLIILSNPR